MASMNGSGCQNSTSGKRSLMYIYEGHHICLRFRPMLVASVCLAHRQLTGLDRHPSQLRTFYGLAPTVKAEKTGICPKGTQSRARENIIERHRVSSSIQHKPQGCAETGRMMRWIGRMRTFLIAPFLKGNRGRTSDSALLFRLSKGEELGISGMMHVADPKAETGGAKRQWTGFYDFVNFFSIFLDRDFRVSCLSAHCTYVRD